MAIRVVNKEPNPTLVKQAVCRSGCGVTVEYAPSDVKCRSCGDGDIFCYVICPKCGKEISIHSLP